MKFKSVWENWFKKNEQKWGLLYVADGNCDADEINCLERLQLLEQVEGDIFL